jgi:hypothetical protein
MKDSLTLWLAINVMKWIQVPSSAKLGPDNMEEFYFCGRTQQVRRYGSPHWLVFDPIKKADDTLLILEKCAEELGDSIRISRFRNEGYIKHKWGCSFSKLGFVITGDTFGEAISKFAYAALNKKRKTKGAYDRTEDDRQWIELTLKG